jgi:hypothetical protein
VSVDSANYSFDDLLWEREWRKCAPKKRRIGTDNSGKVLWEEPTQEELLRGFIYFCENYWHIRHPAKGRILFQLFPAQVTTVESWLGTRYSLILKARQIGFSTLVAAFVFWLTFFYPDRSVVMLSRTEREAIKLLAKAKYGYKFLPEWMVLRGPAVNTTQTKIEFTNESTVESLPSASDPARGESAYLVVVDELAFLTNSEEAWQAIEPVADVGGRVIMLSTANGEGNLFHRLWVEAETGLNRFTPLFFPWSANGRTQEWYEAKKRDTPEHTLAQEYPDNPDDAFAKSGRPVFSLEYLRSIETSPPLIRGYLTHELKFVDDGGALRIWTWPDEDGKYVIGADPSQGMEHSDYASAHVINARNHEVVAHWHGRIDPDLFGTDVLVPLGRFYRYALLGVESNNHGLSTLKAIQRARYKPLYYQRSPQYKRSVPTDILGFRTTQVTKPLMIDELNKSLRDGVMILHDSETIAELRTFTRDDKGKMSGSPFDDRTISLAIANQMLKHVWLPEYQIDEGPPQGSFDWWQDQLYGDGITTSSLTSAKSKLQPRAQIGKHYQRAGVRVKSR